MNPILSGSFSKYVCDLSVTGMDTTFSSWVQLFSVIVRTAFGGLNSSAPSNLRATSARAIGLASRKGRSVNPMMLAVSSMTKLPALRSPVKIPVAENSHDIFSGSWEYEKDNECELAAFSMFALTEFAKQQNARATRLKTAIVFVEDGGRMEMGGRIQSEED